MRLFYDVDAGIEEMRARWLYGATDPVTAPIRHCRLGRLYPPILRLSILRSGPLRTPVMLRPQVFLGAGTPPYTLVKIFYNTEANKNRDVDGDAMLDSTTVHVSGRRRRGSLARNLTGTGTPILTIQSLRRGR